MSEIRVVRPTRGAASVRASRPDPLPPAPRLRVVVLNFNGGELTLRSVAALRSMSWPAGALELVLVDNGSNDGVVAKVERDWADVRIIESAHNLGFAGGNNLALRDLDSVDLVALVNNDVTVPPDWAGPLVDALRADPGLGAACPKVLFEGRYRRVDLTTTAEKARPLDGRSLGVCIADVTVPPGTPGRVRFGSGFFEPQRAGGEVVRWSSTEATLFVPTLANGTESATCDVTLDAPVAKRVQIRSGDARTTIDLRPGRHRYEVALGGAGFDLVNNVGSILLRNHYAADRGWLEPDEGQYDRPDDIFAWSGGAVLLRKDYLRDVGVFDERLFLYYEDLELSWRGRERGWRYAYVPASTVRHVHAATAMQDSPMARYFNERNRLLVLARHAPFRVSAAATVRFLLSTLSYVRRDVVAPVLRGSRPRGDIVLTRLRAFGAFLVGLPSQLRDRVRHK